MPAATSTTPSVTPTPIPAEAPALIPLDELEFDEECCDVDVVSELTEVEELVVSELPEVEELVVVGAEVYDSVPVDGSNTSVCKFEGAGASNVSLEGFAQFRTPPEKLQQSQVLVLLL